MSDTQLILQIQSPWRDSGGGGGVGGGGERGWREEEKKLHRGEKERENGKVQRYKRDKRWYWRERRRRGERLNRKTGLKW